MPETFLGNDWPAVNLGRNYPLVPWASAADTTGSFRIPDDLFVEAYWPTGPETSVDPTRFHVAAVSVSATGLSVSLGYNNAVIATATVARSSLRPFLPVALYGTGDFVGSIGRVVIGRTDGLDSQPAGRFVFSPDAGQLDVDCVRPQLRGVSRIVVDGVSLEGDVLLAMGTNFRAVATGTGGARFDAIRGEGLNEACACGGLAEEAGPIRTINQVPSADGNFSIVGAAGGCVQVATSGKEVRVTDSCSTPCCGCQQRAELESADAYLKQQIEAVRGFLSRLQSEVRVLNSVVLASKVADHGCVSCG